MKKLIVLAAGMLLILSGCSPAALLVADSFKKTMDLTSYESRTSISVNGHFPDAPEDGVIKQVLEVLKSGVVFDTVQKNERESHVSLSVNNPAPVLGSEYWPYQTAPSFDSYTNGNVTYIKSSVDKKYLAFTSEAADGSNNEVSEKMKQFVKAYVNQYDYNPQHLEKVGQEKVTLPDGSVSDATRIRINLDTQEALDIAAYTFDNLSRFGGLKDLPSLLHTLGEAEQDINVNELKSNLSDMAKQIKSGHIEELKASGLDGKIGLDLWIDKDNQLVQNEINIDFKQPRDPAQRSGSDAADVALAIRNQSWNQNKKLTIDYPTEENTVHAESIKKNVKLLNSFDKSSPNRYLAKSEVLAQAEQFDDVIRDNWAYEPVTMLRQMNIVSGYDNNEFLPERSVTRAEFIKMAVGALGLQSRSGNVSFKDNNLIPAWAEQSVQTAVQAGLIDGYEDGSLRPNQPISRAEIVTILVKGYHLSADANYSLTYTDRNQIPDWSVNYVRTAASKGMVDGYEDGSFAPIKHAKRSEVASILYKAIMM